MLYSLCTYKYIQIFTYICACVINPQEFIDATTVQPNPIMKTRSELAEQLIGRLYVLVDLLSRDVLISPYELFAISNMSGKSRAI